MSVIDLGLSASDFVDAIAGSVSGWVAGGLSISVAVLAITIGYRKFRCYCDEQRELAEDFEDYKAEMARYQADYGEEGYR